MSAVIPMVIARLIGGLGNQMFQYAAGRALAHRLRTELKLDVSGFAIYTISPHLDLRQYGLHVFNIVEQFASVEDLSLFANKKRSRPQVLRTYLRRWFGGHANVYYKERHFHYDQRLRLVRGNIYLDGYWNSECYFSAIKDLVREEFTFRQPPAGRNAALLEEIGSVQSVGIHVRRGDYVTNPKAQRLHGVCDVSYYARCAELIASRIDNPHCFVFSDEPDWIRNNLAIPLPHTIVDQNGPLDAHEDLRLMSRCKHQVIANSTFSWWAAWLNPNPEKLVLAPRQWFRSDKHDTRTLFPKSWLLL